MLVLEARVQLVGLGLVLDGPLARVLDRQRRGDDDDLLDAAQAVGLEDHPRHPRVDGQPRELAAHRRQPLAGRLRRIDRAQLVQQVDAVADLSRVGRVQEREVAHRAEVQRGHLQDHRREVGPQDLGVGEARALEEVLLVVEPDADAVRGAAAAALALVGRGLGDRLDRQPLDLQPRAVAAHPRQARVDDVLDARDRQRRLGDVGRQHDAAPAVGLEDLLLLGVGEPRVERQDVDVVAQPAAQRVGGVADLALAAQEHQHVAVAALAQQLVDGVADRLGLVALRAVVGQRQRPVADLDREGAAAHLDHRRVAEVLGELPGVDRRRGDDQLEVGPLGQQLVQEAEQEVDVQRALVGLVDDDGVVAAQQPVVLDLGQQQAVGDQPHQRALAGAVVEAHGVADRLAEVDVELVGDALGDRARGQPPRLGVGDRAADPAAQLQADLGQLRGLARAGLAGDHDNLVVADRRQQVVATRADRQRRRVGDLRDRVAAALHPLLRGGEVAIQPCQRGLVLGMAVRALQPPAEPVLVDQRQLLQAGSELGERHAREDRCRRPRTLVALPLRGLAPQPKCNGASVRPITTSPEILDARALNRALLARQWLLEPRRATALEAIEQLVGLQAQDVKAPYFQLWARLADFDPHELSGLLERREAVRIVLMRGTIHLVSARDALLLRPLVDPVIGRATDGNWSVGDVDRDALAAAGRELVEAEPRTFAQLGALLAERFPDADPRALAQQIRARVGLVQVPPRGLWGQSGAAAHTSIEQWLDGVEAAGAVAAHPDPPLPRRLRPGQRAGHAEVVGPLAPAPGLRGCPQRVGVLRRRGDRP